jgi:uncharacterized membrane protein
MTLLIAISLLAVTAFAHFLPVWTRPDVFFAVTVDPSFRESETAHRVLWSYRAILWSSSVAAIVLLLATGFPELVLVQIGGFFVSLAIAHRRTLLHAAPQTTIVEVVLDAPPETLPGGPVLPLVAPASLLALALWASRHWEQLPARIPVHFGLHGPDRWIAHTTAEVYGFIAAQAAVSLSLILVAWGVLHWSRRNSAGEATARRDRRFRRLNVQMLLLVAYFPAAHAWIALLKPDAMGLWSGAALLLVVIYIIRLIHANRSPTTTPDGDRTPDESWKLGSFYFNPADPSIFVAKHFGIGYTMNFGNRWSWAVLGVVLTVAIFARALLR